MATFINDADVIESFYVSLEELRSSMTRNSSKRMGSSSTTSSSSEDLEFKIPTFERLTKALFRATLELLENANNTNNNGTAPPHDLIASDCYQKACLVVIDCVRWICTGSQTTPTTSSAATVELLPDGGPMIQAAIAQIVECALGIINLKDNNSNGSSKGILIELYSTYQKNLLRQRCKPSVANIVNIRTVAQRQKLTVHQLLLQYSSEVAALAEIDDDNDEQSVENKQQQQQAKLQPHMYALTTILTEATHLLHPLGCWYDAIPQFNNVTNQEESLLRLCHEAIHILDTEVQTLVSRIGSWFIQDRQVCVKWMQQQFALTTTATADDDVSSLCSSSQQLLFLDLQFVDTILLEELSYVCQLLSRYCDFISQCGGGPRSSSCGDGNEMSVPHHPFFYLEQEYIGYYSTLEHALYNTNLQRAIDIAKPVEIYDGIFVSSLVEDAFYLSKKTLERARSTANDQALLTITNRICESWKDGIFDAIASGKGSSSKSLQIQQFNQEVVTSNRDGEVLNSFTAAFLDALDEDMGAPETASNDKNVIGSRPPLQSPPTSLGGAISSSTSLDWHLKTCMCTLNSIASASSACLAISLMYQEIIIDLCQGEMIEENNDTITTETSASLVTRGQNATTKMLDFTREEWLSHSKDYSLLLSNRVQEEIAQWCGVPYDWSSSSLLMDEVSSGNRLLTKMLNIDSTLLPLQKIQKSFAKQNYNIADADGYYRVESDSVLIPRLIDPLRSCPFISQIMLQRCEPKVKVEVASQLTAIIADEIILPMIFVGVGPMNTRKLFTDWGAMLFAKQVRLLQNELCSLLHHRNEDNVEGASSNSHHIHISFPSQSSTAPILSRMERVTQVVTILQLEKPSDWTSFQYAAAGVKEDSRLTSTEIREVMMLRKGFSKEAVAALCDAL